jgi:hypothetical protein
MYGVFINGSTHLSGTRCFHDPLYLVKIQTGVFPGKATVFEKPPRFPFLIVNHILISHIEDSTRQNLMPVVHQLGIDIAVITAKFGQIIGKGILA